MFYGFYYKMKPVPTITLTSIWGVSFSVPISPHFISKDTKIFDVPALIYIQIAVFHLIFRTFAKNEINAFLILFGMRRSLV